MLCWWVSLAHVLSCEPESANSGLKPAEVTDPFQALDDPDYIARSTQMPDWQLAQPISKYLSLNNHSHPPEQ